MNASSIKSTSSREQIVDFHNTSNRDALIRFTTQFQELRILDGTTSAPPTQASYSRSWLLPVTFLMRAGVKYSHCSR
jgi:hypothetical protein